MNSAEVVDDAPVNEDAESEVQTKQEVEAEHVESSAQISSGKSTMVPFKEHKHGNKIWNWN